MTYRELLHIKLMEECGETIQCESKLLRFGEHQIQDEHKTDNFDRVQEEILDIVFTANLLGYRILLGPGEIALRQDRLDKYMERSRILGQWNGI